MRFAKKSPSAADSQAEGKAEPTPDALAEVGAWPREDLVRRLLLSFRIATRSLAYLDGGFVDQSELEASFGPDKPFAETAMLLYVASAVDDPDVVLARTELCRLLEGKTRTPGAALALAQYPSICLQLAIPHILLSRMGFADKQFDRLLALSVQSPSHEGREVEPYRALEQQWLASLWRREPPPDEAFDAAVSRSLLAHPLDLINGMREDFYAHTHLFMYFTDFGFTPRPLPRPRAELIAEASAVVASSLLADDYDIAAEALLAWPMTGAPWNAAAAFGFRVLCDLEDEVGFLPAKSGAPARFHELEGEERTRYALAASYHTAYVMGILVGLLLRPALSPPVGLAGDPADDRLVDELISVLPADDRPWRRTLARLTTAERQTLATFLIDMALLDRARQTDYRAVGRLLALAASNGLADTPVAAQAAGLLERVAAAAAMR